MSSPFESTPTPVTPEETMTESPQTPPAPLASIFAEAMVNIAAAKAAVDAAEAAEVARLTEALFALPEYLAAEEAALSAKLDNEIVGNELTQREIATRESVRVLDDKFKAFSKDWDRRLRNAKSKAKRNDSEAVKAEVRALVAEGDAAAAEWQAAVRSLHEATETAAWRALRAAYHGPLSNERYATERALEQVVFTAMGVTSTRWGGVSQTVWANAQSRGRDRIAELRQAPPVDTSLIVAKAEAVRTKAEAVRAKAKAERAATEAAEAARKAAEVAAQAAADLAALA